MHNLLHLPSRPPNLRPKEHHLPSAPSHPNPIQHNLIHGAKYTGQSTYLSLEKPIGDIHSQTTKFETLSDAL